MTTLDELLANEKPAVVAAAQEKADNMLLAISLREVRKLTKKTQVDIANALGVTQPTVSGMEKAGQDLRLTSLKRYVEASGGTLRLDVELPDGTHHAFPL